MNLKKIGILCLGLMAGGLLQAKVRLASVFGSDMVLQRQCEAPLWGWAEPGAEVAATGSWDGSTVRTRCGADGKWMLKLKTPDVGGPYTVTVSDGEAVTLENVLIGEVWICSGQSNMEMPVGGWGRVRDYAREIESADWPRIRLFGVKRVSSLAPREDVQVVGGGWQPCSPQTVPDFSAAGYFFARELHKALGVPVGVINTSWGGTVAESWMSPEALATHSDFAERVEQVRSAGADESRLWAGFRDDSARWEQVVAQRDPAYRDGKCLWKERSFDDSDWDTITLPAYFDAECLPGHDGIVWLRRRIEIPARWRGRDLTLRLSYVDDRDVTYFNGVQVGATHALEQERVYQVPGRLVEGGEAVIAIRVLDTGGDGGLNYDGPSLRLSLSDDRYIPLSGPWRYRVGSELADLPAPPVQPDFNPHQPTALYHSMLRPLVPLAFRGAVWYQGESNAWRAEQYGTLFPLLVEDWRSCWGCDFPFLFVQLANFGARHDEPAASQWAELREAQSEALHLDGTAMAVAIDIGEGDNIHPKNKQELGRRLALIARARVYGESVACSGPVYRTYRIEGDKIRIRFDEAEGLAVRDGRVLRGFAVAGADRRFHWAEAAIDGCDVVVGSPEVPYPLAVRYGWDDNPDCNLINASGLPASPFRTDRWPGITTGKK